jgi:hypothetical protein
MNCELLRTDLAELADESVPVDLREAVLRGSRRATVRRRVALAVTAAAVTIIAMGTAAAVLPRRGAMPAQPGVSSSATPLVFNVTALPSTVTVLRDVHPSMGAWSERPGPDLPGRAIFVSLGDTGRAAPQPVELSILEAGVIRTAPLGELAPSDCFLGSVAVSPDGENLSWVEEYEPGQRELVIAPVTGGEPIAYALNLTCGGGDGPRWAPDNQTLLVQDRDRGPGKVDARSGFFTPIPALPRYGAYSYSGTYHAYADGNDIVVDAGTTEVHRTRYPGFPVGDGLFSVQSVSDDGTLVGINHSYANPTTIRGSIVVVDVTTGTPVQLPLPTNAEGPDAVFFGPGGSRLIQATTADGIRQLNLYSPDGHRIGHAVLPATFGANWPGLLHYQF